MCNKTVLEMIEESKETHETNMKFYNKQMKDHIASGYKRDCDWYSHRQIMSEYHRGAYNALNDLEREIRGDELICLNQ